MVPHIAATVVLCGLAAACEGTSPARGNGGPQSDVTALARHGEYPTLLAELRRAPETAASLLDQANALALLGRFEEVQTSLARVAAMLPSDPTLRSSIAIVRARVSLGQGRIEPATLHARRALDLIQVDGQDTIATVDTDVDTDRVIRMIRIDALVILCRANVMARRVRAAHPFCREAVERAAVFADPRLTALTLIAEAEERLADDDATGAATLAEEAIDIASTLRHTPYRLHALSLAARAYGRLDDQREGRFRGYAASAMDSLLATWGAEALTDYLQRVDLDSVLRE